MFTILGCNCCQPDLGKFSLLSLNIETCSEDPTKATFLINKMQDSILSTGFDVSSAALLQVSSIDLPQFLRFRCRFLIARAARVHIYFLIILESCYLRGYLIAYVFAISIFEPLYLILSLIFSQLFIFLRMKELFLMRGCL